MRLERLSLRGFRNYTEAEVLFAPGLTALLGRNGQGKTNVLEAIGYLATLRSFRGAGGDVLVQDGAEKAILRAELRRTDGREVLIEAEITRSGRNRVQLNRQRLTRAADLLGTLAVTVFTPEDLAVVKTGPQARRDLLDDALVVLDPRFELTRRNFERVLRQRNALLKQLVGRGFGGARRGEAAPGEGDGELTLSVWDSQLVPVGETVRAARVELVGRLEPWVRDAYHSLSKSRPDIELVYRSSFTEGGYGEALEAARRDELRRGVTLVGPHRDDLDITLSGHPARTHGSQGEQRSLALALKLAVHRLATETLGQPPVLLLDDVFSELDPQRAAGLLQYLPHGQTVLTSADRLPEGTSASCTYRVDNGRLDAVELST